MTHIIDKGHRRSYHTELPNIIFHLGLSAYELALYSTLKRTTGETGSSYKGTRKLAKESGMSVGMIVKTKASLLRTHELLDNKPLLSVTKRKTEQGDDDTDRIEIIDIWDENFDHFRKERCSPREQRCSQNEHGVHDMNLRITPKEEHKIDIPKGISSPSHEKCDSDPKKSKIFYNREKGDFEGLSSEKMEKLKKTYPDLNIEQEMQKIRLWLEENPKGKRRKGTWKFIQEWISRGSECKEYYQKQKAKPEVPPPVCQYKTRRVS